MNLRHYQLYYLILGLFSHFTTCGGFAPILTIPALMKYVSTIAKSTINLQTKLTSEKDEGRSERLTIIKRLHELSTDFQEMKDLMMVKISEDLRDKFTARTDKLFKYIKSVQNLYEDFLDIYANPQGYKKSELANFAEVSTSRSSVELKAIVSKMHDVFIDPDIRGESIISIIAKRSSAADTMCARGQSAQQLINQLFEIVTTTDAKALLVILYGLQLKEKLENENYGIRKQQQMDKFKWRITDTFNKVKDALKVASREVWRCDLANHKFGDTYSKLEDIFQSFFVYETDIHRNRWGALIHSCDSYKDVRLRCRSYPCQVQPKNRRCRGHLRDCQHIDDTMQICHAPPGSDRRYQWMKNKDDVYFGHKNDKCDYTQGLSSIFVLDHCLCNCESEKREADRYFSLQDVTSDIEQNKVVTGVRIVIKNHVFSIEIQQGTLGQNGTIIDIPEWQPNKAIEIDDLLSKNISTYHYYITSHALQNMDRITKYEEWVDFYDNKLVYPVTYDRNTVYLDDLEGPANTVITGLRFHQIQNNLRLEVRTTVFSPLSGQLNLASSSWLANSNNIKEREEIHLREPDDPGRNPKTDKVSQNNQYIRFAHTNLEKDLGQNTVPFIDLQEVVTNPVLPLAGVGLFHKRRDGSGGFLALKLIHYDLTSYL